MPKSKSAQRQLRKSRERRLRNQALRSRVKTEIRKARTALSAKAPQSEALVRLACRIADRAAAKGALHPNAAARRKSRLMKRAHQAAAAAQ